MRSSRESATGRRSARRWRGAVITTTSGLVVLVGSGFDRSDLVGRGRLDFLGDVSRLALDRLFVTGRRSRRGGCIGEHVLGEIQMWRSLDRRFALRAALGIDTLQ